MTKSANQVNVKLSDEDSAKLVLLAQDTESSMSAVASALVRRALADGYKANVGNLREGPAMAAALSKHDACRIAGGISTSTLDRLCKNGEIDSFTVGRRRLIDEASLTRFLDRQRATRNDDRA